MKCTLCKSEILNYDPAINHLKIDENSSADICLECIDKLMKWQQGVYARLFPTNAVKKRKVK